MTDPTQSALDLLQTFQTLYTSQHVFRPVEAAQFPWVKRKFYDQTQVKLEKFGFYKLVDLEDATVNSTNPPKSRTFIRSMVSADQAIMAGIYHMPPQPVSLLVRLILFFMRSPRQSFVVDFETELSDGSFLVTTNAALAAAIQFDIPTLHQQFFPATTTVERLYKSHQSALEKLMEHSGAQPLTIKTFEDIEASQHRLQALKNSYRQSVGLLNAEDIDRVADGRYQKEAGVLKQALEHVKTPKE
jgi:hypothetical protein